jgi:hypothetical protein
MEYDDLLSCQQELPKCLEQQSLIMELDS